MRRYNHEVLIAAVVEPVTGQWKESGNHDDRTEPSHLLRVDTIVICVIS